MFNQNEPKDGKHQDGDREADTQAAGGNDNVDESKAEENVGAGDLVD